MCFYRQNFDKIYKNKLIYFSKYIIENKSKYVADSNISDLYVFC